MGGGLLEDDNGGEVSMVEGWDVLLVEKLGVGIKMGVSSIESVIVVDV